MKILWTDFAIASLADIYKYYKENANVQVARKIRTSIFSATKHLTKHPQSGQVELTLERLEEEHRYVSQGNYKIVYKQVSEGILITDVFDTRQDPLKINNPERKPEK